jgi:hypothetical protein
VRIVEYAAAIALALYALFFLYGTFREVRRYVRIVRRLREAHKGVELIPHASRREFPEGAR